MISDIPADKRMSDGYPSYIRFVLLCGHDSTNVDGTDGTFFCPHYPSFVHNVRLSLNPSRIRNILLSLNPPSGRTIRLFPDPSSVHNSRMRMFPPSCLNVRLMTDPSRIRYIRLCLEYPQYPLIPDQSRSRLTV